MRAVLFVAVIAIAIIAAAGTAVAASTDTDHLGTDKLDKLHEVRPIAASPTATLSSAAGKADSGAGAQASSTERSLQVSPDAPGLADFLSELAGFIQARQAQVAVDAYLAALAAASPPPAAAPPSRSTPTDVGSFLACIRWRESRGVYTVYNSQGSGAAGAYQFLPSTWNSIAAATGRTDLIGVDPAKASPSDQDAMAAALYAQRGSAPWGGACG